MTIETKFLIGLLLLMGIGALLASFLGSDASWNTLTTAATNFANSFDNFDYKSIWTVMFQGGKFLFTLVGFFGTCIFWNFSFFKGFEAIQVLLIFINLAVLVKILVDVFRMLKPFGS